MLGKFLKKTPQLVDRDGERYDISVRVLSRELPGYRGVTLDMSRSGVQLETSGILDVGMQPELKFEFDRGEVKTFTCSAKVVWSRPEGPTGRRFRSGLTFLPKTDDEIRQLSCMSTVLQTRSETDLKTLLDQAGRIDPELQETYGNVSGSPALSIPPQDAPVATGAPPPPPSQEQNEKKKSPPFPGLYIPLNVTLEGYTWNRASKTLHLGLREGEQCHNLYFGDCQLFQVLEPAADKPIVGLYSINTSPATRKLELQGDQAEYKHYRLVTEGGKGLVDIISGACRPQP